MPFKPISKLKRYSYNIDIALDAMSSNKTRALLSGIGIMFGVASVISMLAIGNGAQKEILEQIKNAGVNNIVIQSTLTPVNTDEETDKDPLNAKMLSKSTFTPGLTISDLKAIENTIPIIRNSSPVVSSIDKCTYKNSQETVKLNGVSRNFFNMFNFNLQAGSYFEEYHETNVIQVCIIENSFASQMFTQQNPIGEKIRFGNVWLEVVGIVNNQNTEFDDNEKQKAKYNIYTPYSTFLYRIKNQRPMPYTFNQQTRVMMLQRGINIKNKNYHQLDKIIIQVKKSEQLVTASTLLHRTLLRRHNKVEDFKIVVPELLLKNEQRTKRIFNIILGLIAGISLLVGGIGIMNIMYASVTERTKEIGTSLAIGANKTDIKLQYLFEAVLISITGGFVGIALGISLSYIIQNFFNILSIVSLPAILLSFIISVGTGIIFGYIPASKASQKNPVESLRYE